MIHGIEITSLFTFDEINIFILIAGVFGLVFGLMIISRGKVSRAHMSFFLFALTNAIWAISKAVYRSTPSPSLLLFTAHCIYVVPALVPLAFIIFIRDYASPEKPSARWYAAMTLPAILVAIISAIPNLLITGVVRVPGAEPVIYFHEIWHVAYFLYIIVYSGIGVWLLRHKFIEADRETKGRLTYITIGSLVPLVVTLITNLVLPVFGIFTYNWIGQISMFTTTSIIAFGILRERVFDIRIIATELLVFFMWVIVFGRILLSSSLIESIFNIVTFGALLAIGLLLSQSVYNEVQQREFIERQKNELVEVNTQQENLLHFMSHEVKAYLVKGQDAFAGIAEGDYGDVSPLTHDLAAQALVEMRRGNGMIMDILDAANLKRGTVRYEMKAFDLSATVEDLVNEVRGPIERKGLRLEYTKPVTGSYAVIGDKEKFVDHVLRNLIENSMLYTQTGTIRIELSRNDRVTRVVVSDTGVGITPEDMSHLFTEGGRGKDSIRLNVHSTGYGLFVAKTVVDAHHGKIWAESEGAGKGSRFIVELPIG